MKRMHFDFDFEDNELFDEQTEKVIKAKVREVVRKENYNIIADETRKELDRLIDDGKQLYYSEIRNIIKDRIETIISDVLNNIEYKNIINEAIANKISYVIDCKIKVIDSSINKDVREAVNEIINAAVTEKLSKIFDTVGDKDEK